MNFDETLDGVRSGALAHPNFTDIGPENAFQSLSQIQLALPRNSGPIALGFHGSEIGDEGAKQLAQMLAGNTSIRNLSLPDNGITDEGARALLGLAQSPDNRISTISLTQNDISPDLLEEINAALGSKARASRVQRPEETRAGTVDASRVVGTKSL